MKINRHSLIALLVLFSSLLICTACFDKNKKKDYKTKNSFNVKLVKATIGNENYLISPYSIEIALNMLKEGADGNTKAEIEKVLPDRKIGDVSVKNKVNVANALFISDYYKKFVRKEYKIKLIDDYKSELLYDEFKTPDVINNWVNDKTNGLIKKILDKMDDDFVLGIANALAIDVEWEVPFNCSSTNKQKFTKVNGKEINVEMMHGNYTSSDFKYLETKDATGIVLPYKSYDRSTGKADNENGRKLEFIGILPANGIKDYLDNLSEKNINELINSAKSASSEYEIQVSLPRFKYEYSVNNFKQALENIGINDAFDGEKADFSGIMKKSDMKNNLYVSDAIHKTYIDLNEKGTKAAAVTYFGMKNYAAILDENKKIVEIKFDKPFVYMIRDSKTKEVLFFGAVFEPNIWSGKTCGN